MNSQKILYILRHAKTHLVGSGQDDAERALMPRGIDDAHTLGEYLSHKGIKMDRILCSTAVRACQTWACIEETYKTGLEPDYSDKLYLASPSEIIQVVQDTPESASHVMIIGHNPGLHQFCLQLARQGDERLLRALAQKFSTCTLATITLNTAWYDISHAKGTLAGLTTPQILAAAE